MANIAFTKMAMQCYGTDCETSGMRLQNMFVALKGSQIILVVVEHQPNNPKILCETFADGITAYRWRGACALGVQIRETVRPPSDIADSNRGRHWNVYRGPPNEYSNLFTRCAQD